MKKRVYLQNCPFRVRAAAYLMTLAALWQCHTVSQTHQTCSAICQCNKLTAVIQVKAERPVWYLSVMCGALLRVIEQVNLRSADYLGFLEKGQLPPARLTLTSFEQQLVLEGEPASIVMLGC